MVKVLMDFQLEQGLKAEDCGPGVAEATHSCFLAVENGKEENINSRKLTPVTIIDQGYYCLLLIFLFTEKAET